MRPERFLTALPSLGECVFAAELSYRLGQSLSREEAGLHYYYLGEKLGLDLTIPEEITVDRDNEYDQG